MVKCFDFKPVGVEKSSSTTISVLSVLLNQSGVHTSRTCGTTWNSRDILYRLSNSDFTIKCVFWYYNKRDVKQTCILSELKVSAAAVQFQSVVLLKTNMNITKKKATLILKLCQKEQENTLKYLNSLEEFLWIFVVF